MHSIFTSFLAFNLLSFFINFQFNFQTIEKISLLVPEICYFAGITDSIRSDFRITKDLATVTNVGPEQRRQVIRNFIQQVNGMKSQKKFYLIGV